jgi:hypothetical protein
MKKAVMGFLFRYYPSTCLKGVRKTTRKPQPE